MSRELEEKAQLLAELKKEVAGREAVAVEEATISQKCSIRGLCIVNVLGH
jgi:hypothetical protein